MLLSNTSSLAAAPARRCRHTGAHTGANPGAHESLADHAVRDHAQRAHLAHAMVVGAHTVCCAGPILAAGLAALSGVGLIAGIADQIHTALHAYEWHLVGVSGMLVVIGAVLEWRLRRSGVRRMPWLFVLSCAAFLANAAIVVSHAGSPLHAEAHVHHVEDRPSTAAAMEPAPAPDDGAPRNPHRHDDHHHPH